MPVRFARLLSGTVSGIDALLVEVEVDVSRTGDPQVVVVGLLDAAVKESHHRVATALANSGFEPSRGRVVVNLAPADIHKTTQEACSAPDPYPLHPAQETTWLV